MTDQNAPLILVVDDYQDAREMYAEYLQFSGFRVAEARNGNEAVDQAFALKPDLILMDLSLPGMDGWEATRRLKADERTRHIPIVALTGHALAGASEGAKKAGCDSFVTKPCLPDDLVVEVRRMLNAVKQGQASHGQAIDGAMRDESPIEAVAPATARIASATAASQARRATRGSQAARRRERSRGDAAQHAEPRQRRHAQGGADAARRRGRATDARRAPTRR